MQPMQLRSGLEQKVSQVRGRGFLVAALSEITLHMSSHRLTSRLKGKTSDALQLPLQFDEQVPTSPLCFSWVQLWHE